MGRESINQLGTVVVVRIKEELREEENTVKIDFNNNNNQGNLYKKTNCGA